ncbi:ankyrin repeat domain-containing protein [Wolbachia endosymbiont of Ctenocephalides felis wCfeT]|uniref:ankyrin repeat domain-containing protein n=1 Tax=Wolbachia endosymbiont of Ctenocephalides felis wCfeT TaxID=2732593 RepID=UPI0014454A95|nr:ankyrin repeat domain-containing protein [Wolbachia endosymbiont of Ctenocephalides felis wCfeT]
MTLEEKKASHRILLRQVVNKRIKKGKVNHKDMKHGQTILHCVALDGDLESARKLLSVGAKLNIEDDYGRNPLYYAALRNHKELLSFFITANSKINNDRVELLNVLDKLFTYGYWLSPLTVGEGETSGVIDPSIRNDECKEFLIQRIILDDPNTVKPYYIRNHPEFSKFWDECKNQYNNKIPAQNSNRKYLVIDNGYMTIGLIIGAMIIGYFIGSICGPIGAIVGSVIGAICLVAAVYGAEKFHNKVNKEKANDPTISTGAAVTKVLSKIFITTQHSDPFHQPGQ